MASRSSEHFEDLARAWDAAGRPDDLVIKDEWKVFLMISWMRSTGATAEGYSDVLYDFSFACHHVQFQTTEHWFARLSCTRDYCGACGERLMVSNMSVCTLCSALYCFGCAPTKPVGSNGNVRCSCDGDLVVDTDPAIGVSFRVTEL